MRRRDVVATLLLAVVPGVATAQGRRARIDVLLFGTPAESNVAALLSGLRDAGWVEGRNLSIEYRSADGRPERLPALAAAAVATTPDLIVAMGGDVAPFARDATRQIPVVMLVSNDPVEAGLVASLNQPGGNLTGVAFPAAETAAKRLQFLREAAPSMTRVGMLWSPDHPDGEYRNTRAAARDLRFHVHALEVRQLSEFDPAFAVAAKERIEALIVATSRLMNLNRARIFEFVDRQKIPLVSGWGPWARAGALLSYGPDLDDLVRRAATHIDKILKGARPGNLPIEQPTKFQLVLNRKTATALGITLPSSLLLRADAIIE